VQVDILILYAGNEKKYDASSASGYITGMHFSTHCVDVVGRGCLECHHVGWDVVRLYPGP
jgi:hypothetical protein